MILIPAAKFELFIPDNKLDLVVRTIKVNAMTGEDGDGVIAVSDLESCINITPMND